MEMIIPGMAVTGQASAISGTSATKTGTGAEGSFKQALVQQIVSESTSSGGSAQQPGLLGVITSQNAIVSLNAAEAAVSTEDLMSLIDGLMDKLDAATENVDADPGSMQDQLQSMLYALQALLALLGIPTPRTSTSAWDTEQSGGMAQNAQALEQTKASMQVGLIQLQTLLQQGSLKQIQGQEPLALIANQLQALSAALVTDESGKENGSPKADANTLPSWLVAQPAASKDASALLQRLSQQSVHPSALQAVMSALSEGQAVQTPADSQANVPADQSATVQLPLVGPHNVRDFAPLLARSAAPTAFVLADNFADTMNGLIVQKFNIRSVDGLSEAKLKLFPEQLGQVDVRISMQNGVLTAMFQTDTAKAKDMLENQMAQLRAALQAQGLNVEKLEVTQSPATMELSHQQGGPGQQGKQGSDNRSGFGEDENVTDNAFESELVEQAAIQGLGYGRAINEMA
ncbi:flagellar hook-length control protein FliK [Paenibacillus sp. 1011MAR3C5]|uniref:flagellar hook-length control protein FliK n=1 Tax=Paenibacillus sp. 1011MAR3C5 TaxID=1675787 RepID=UPI000E6CA8D1|nr:flagellar hook-length control protein FliK [Paenibacillus sp. 1011MAR3C5]RJE86754.1 flagellar hook-length control protein FliK [Paenibacillus sp. 1011MAR3C5]